MPVGIARLNVFVFVVSYFILYFSLLSIFWIFQTFWIFYCKSSDLFMINPHFSLNPWNSRISSAILRYHEDFYSEIHGFHEQSSDLTQRISLNPCQIWGFIHLLCLRVSVSYHFPLRCNVICFWELDLSEQKTDLNADCLYLFDLDLC